MSTPLYVEPDDQALTAWLFLPCAGGVEALLAAEITSLLGPAVRCTPRRGGVALRGTLGQAMALNLGCRLAQRVLVQVAHGAYRDEHDLYHLGRTVPWDAWITPSHTFKVDVTAQHSPLRSLNFAALRVKDAVCDTLRDHAGDRPNVDTQRPDLRVMLHLTDAEATLYADTSGEPLFKRGWREDTGEAPLKETLAAAMLAAADWQGRPEDGTLLEPCCGAGTIAIEAAQIACGMAPGLTRHFAFERLGPFQPALATWRELQARARARVHAPQVAIVAGDVSFRMTDFAERNAQRAGVRDAIDFKTVDALQRPAPAERGIIILNPPYGERIAPKGQGQGDAGLGRAEAPRASREAFDGGADPSAFFSALASHWKRQYPGWTAWVLSPDLKLPSLMRFKESRKVPMWNGPIECRLFRFDLVAGSARGNKLGAGGGESPNTES